jgi:hypothetical protein
MRIKVIIKRPDEEYGHMTHISDTLENLQKTVEGHIEILPLGRGVIAVLNEQGKILGLDPNMKVPGDILVGTIVLCGTSGEDLADIPISFQEWKEMKDNLEGKVIRT